MEYPFMCFNRVSFMCAASTLVISCCCLRGWNMSAISERKQLFWDSSLLERASNLAFSSLVWDVRTEVACCESREIFESSIVDLDWTDRISCIDVVVWLSIRSMRRMARLNSDCC